MVEYFCKEHNTAFFKSKKMKRYAHPIEGTEPTGWCNMPEGQEPEPEETAPAPNGKPDMSKEDWAEKDRQERWSRECNTCFMGIMELAKAYVEKDVASADIPIFQPVYDAALDWALDHFQTDKPAAKPTQKASPEATQSTTGASKTDLGSLVFADAGKLLTYLQNELGMNDMQRAAATKGFDLKTEQGRKDCWSTLIKMREKKNEEDIAEAKEAWDSLEPDGIRDWG